MKRGKQVNRGGMWILFCSIVLTLGIGSVQANSPSAKVREFSVSREKGGVKVTLSADQPIGYQVSRLANPAPMLVMDLSPAVLWDKKQTRLIQQAGVRDFRIAQYSSNPDVVRLVLDLDHPVQYSVQSSPDHRQLFLSLNSSNDPGISGSAPPRALSSAFSAPVASRLPAPAMQASPPLYVARASAKKKKIRTQKYKKPVRYAGSPELITYHWRGANLPDVIRLLADRLHLNVIIDNAVTGTVTLDLNNVPAQQALSMIAALNGYGVRQVGNVLVVAPPDKLDKVPTTAVALGPQATQVIPLENSKASDMQASVTRAFSGIQVDTDSRLNALIVRGSVGQIRQVMNLVSQLDKPAAPTAASEQAVIQLNYADQNDVVTQLKPLLPSDAILIADKRMNTLIVVGSPYAVETVRSFVRAVDVPTPQVMLSMEVVSVEDKASRDLGVEWDPSTTTNFMETAAGDGAPGNPSTPFPASGSTTLPTKNTLALQSMGIHSFVRDNLGIKAILHWLISHEKAKTLGSPRLTTMNNTTANIQLGQQLYLPYFDPRAGTYQAQAINVGVILKITPTISPNGDIKIHLEPQVSQITALSATVPQYPTISTRNADTWVQVKNGQTIVIGGLLQSTDDEVITKIPLLGDIPILGEFFRHRTLNHDKTDLVITVTPTLLANR